MNEPMIDGTSALKCAVLTPEEEARFQLGKAMEVLTLAKAVKVTSDEEYAAADAAVAAIKSAQRLAEAKRTSLTKPLNDTLKRINADFKPIDAAFEEALAFYRRPMSAYQAELARQRAEAEAEARRERERLEAEARAKAESEMEEARKAQEAADAARQAIESAEDPLAALLAQEDAQEAERKAQEQIEAAKQAIRETASVVVIVPEVPKVTGSASKTHTVWKYEITDPALVPLRYRPIDEAAIARDVRTLKSDCEIPGVRIYSEIEVR